MAGLIWTQKNWVAQRLFWEGRRHIRLFVWRFGWLGVLALICLIASSAALLIEHQQTKSLKRARSAAAYSQTIQSIPSDMAKGDSGSKGVTRLQAFDAYLPPHDEIPHVLKNLISLATDSGLLLARGEYKAQAEMQGGFLRYGMTLPVKGDPQAIHTFILTALAQNRTLALEGIQFKREQIESPEIEARIQWVLLTRLPSDSPTATGSGSWASRRFE
jgi:hypothetical protein